MKVPLSPTELAFWASVHQAPHSIFRSDFHDGRRSPGWRLGPTVLKQALTACLLLAASRVPSHAGIVNCAAYHCHNGITGECQPEVCDYDSVTYDDLSVSVNQGFVPGPYEIKAEMLGNVWQTVVVTVANDGSYTVSGDYWGGWAPNVARWTWFIDLPPGPATVDPDTVIIYGPFCDGSATLQHGGVRVTIGSSPPAPAPDANPHKPNDATAGGTGQDGSGENGPLNGGDDCHGMARYTVDLLTVSLKITDTPIQYMPPRGPEVNFTLSYNQRDADQSPTQQYSNLGANWTFNWLSYVADDPVNLSANASVYVRGGGTEVYSAFNSTTQSYAPDPQSQAQLVRTSTASYEKRFLDGSKLVYAQSNGALAYPRLIFLTQYFDPVGNAVTIHYAADGSNRIDYIADALGQQTTFSYENSADPEKITKVTDPFGRFAAFGYANGQLTSSTDPVGIVSQFGYAADSTFINSLTTPYGVATFATGGTGTNRWLNLTDPEGGNERIEYLDNAPGISPTDPANSVPAIGGIGNAHLDVRNTFYFDKKTLSDYPPANGVYDYTKAKIHHWLLSADGISTSGTMASEKMPLENRIWYTYPGQSDYDHAGPEGSPSQTARVLSDGTTQVYQAVYNTLGNVIKATDPLGRVTSYVYDTNGIDLLATYQRNPAGSSLDPDGQHADEIAANTYNSQHEPLTSTDAAGQPTTRTYNAGGQLLTSTNAKSETTTYAYGGTVPDGYLASITLNDPSAITTFTYDPDHRVRTVTDSDGYTVTTDYDDLDRKTQVTYPDGTNRQFQYSQDFGNGSQTILDLTASKDRDGRWTYRHYNGNRQMDSITDPLSQTTLYEWCTCGALTSITDPNGNVTTFNRDLQNRVASKVFADNSSITYTYENTTSRLQSMKDALGQTTSYQYFGDNNIRQISYSNALNLTPTVSYTYDPYYNRITSMVDGIGTTGYSYYPVASGTLGAEQLYQVDGPFCE